MTKVQEQQIFERLDRLEKEVVELRKYKENNQLDKHTYSVLEASEILGRSKPTIYNMIEKGELETIKCGSIKILGSSLKKVLGHDV